MRRLTIGMAAAVMLLAFAPAGALAGDHHSHLRHVENARVASFSGGVLTIMLRNGSTLRGKVNRGTELKCTTPAGTHVVHDGDQSANDGPGDAMDANDNNEAAEPPDNEAAEAPDNEAAEAPDNEAAEAPDNEAAEAPENEAAEPPENDVPETPQNEVERSCSTMNSPGTVVREAVLRISSSGHGWKQVELEP